MPIYEYKCTGCGAGHEFIQKFSDEPMAACPDCGGKLTKLISNTSFVLKGSGWYVTDYASGERKKAQEAEKKPEAADKKAEAKAETNAGSKAPAS